MAKKIENLSWKCMWTTHIGCIKGCLDFLGIKVSDGWLFGASGHAFIINLHEVVCASGPTAWHTEMLLKLSKNVGCVIEGISVTKRDADFAELQKQAWESTQKALDDDTPCYGWELEIPEYYVVYGYDDAGYYFSGPKCDEGKGPKPWQELGDSDIGFLEMFTVKPSKSADDIKTVKEALTFALEHSKDQDKWTYPKYKTGLAGYDNWIKALEEGKADGFGMAYNSAVWSECRHHAVEFLKEAKERVGGKAGTAFEEAIGHYQQVAENLKKVADTFPFLGLEPEHIADEARISTGLECLRKARSSEEAGLKALEGILSEL